jgi:hypothetical protein
VTVYNGFAQGRPAGNAGILGEISGTLEQAGAAVVAAECAVGVAARWVVVVFGVVVWAVAAVVKAARRAIEESFAVIVIPV